MKLFNIKNYIKSLLYDLDVYKSFPNWKKIKKKDKGKVNNNQYPQKKILICTSTPGHKFVANIDLLIAETLKKLNQNISFFICDSALPACLLMQYDNQKIEEKNKKICSYCNLQVKFGIKQLGFNYFNFSTFFYEENEKKINIFFDTIDLKNANLQNIFYKGINVGQQAFAGSLRYSTKSGLDMNDKADYSLFQKYLYAAMKTTEIAYNFFNKHKFDIIILHHGIYVPQGIILDVAKLFNIQIVTYTKRYKRKTIELAHDDTYHLTNLKNHDDWKIDLTESKEKKLMNYLYAKRDGSSSDWINYQSNVGKDFYDLVSKFENTNKKKNFLLLTNIIWDGIICYPQNIFENMLDWLNFTINYFIKNPDLNLIVRIHPGEEMGTPKAVGRVYDHIIAKYKMLPKNIIIIKPIEKINTYKLAEFSENILIYATRTGIELAPFGKNVIVCGESELKNKKISFDPIDKNEYLTLLENYISLKMSNEQILNAKKFAYYYFFNKMIEIEPIIPKINNHEFDLDKDFYKKLNNGDYKNLEMICRNIVSKRPFILDEN